MNLFRRITGNWPLHLILLPFFFIIHLYVQFAGLLYHREVFIAFLKISGCLALSFLVWNLVMKNSAKAAVITTISGILFLFFGDIKFFFAQLPLLNHLAHYRFFLPLLSLLSIIAVIKIRRSRQLIRTTLFLNILFILYITIDIGRWFFPVHNKTGLVNTNLLTTDRDLPKNRNNSLPNIYYILLDCYPATDYQREMLGVNNNYFDSSLGAKGFYVLKKSRSNYNFTAFSMAATLGMNYFSNIDTVNRIGSYNYNYAIGALRKAPLFTFLNKTGYTFYNLSIFDFLNYPAFKKELFLSISTTQLVFYNTLWSCLVRDFTWQLFPGLIKKQETIRKENRQKFFSPQKTYNLRLLDTLSKFPVAGNSPYFVYAHLAMPHFPYFFDSTGTPYPEKSIYTDSLITDKNKFANYISYTNQKMEKLLTELLKKSSGQDVIIIQSDHGLSDMDWSRQQDAFRNYTAYYFPDKDYRMLSDSMSNVNTFRVLLNKYFGQQLPLLPDRSYFIR